MTQINNKPKGWKVIISKVAINIGCGSRLLLLINDNSEGLLG